MPFAVIFSISLVLLGSFIIYKTAQVVLNKVLLLNKSGVLSGALIGICLLPLMTALPNILVSLAAIFNTVPDLVYSSNLGNNITNITLVVALAALVSNNLVVNKFLDKKSTSFSPAVVPYCATDERLIKRDAVFLLGSSLITALLLLDQSITRIDGVILTTLFLLYVFVVIRQEKPVSTDTKLNKTKTSSVFGNILLIIVAGGFMYIGAELIVRGAQQLIGYSGLSDSFVGATIVSLAIVIPNAVIIMYSALKNNFNLSFANLIGDSLAAAPFTIGIITIIQPQQIPDGGLIIVYLFIAANILFFLMTYADIFRFKFFGDPDIKHEEAVFLLAAYFLFSYILFLSI